MIANFFVKFVEVVFYFSPCKQDGKTQRCVYVRAQASDWNWQRGRLAVDRRRARTAFHHTDDHDERAGNLEAAAAAFVGACAAEAVHTKTRSCHRA
jgi:hypothetical protein